MSSPPKLRTAASSAPATSLATVTSQTSPWKSGRSYSDSTFGSRSSATTAAPAARNASAVALPIPEAAPVIGDHFAEERRLGPGALELGLLELPVLDVEQVTGRQRAPFVERVGSADDLDRVQVDVLDDAGRRVHWCRS